MDKFSENQLEEKNCLVCIIYKTILYSPFENM